jgi:predicted transposase YdaD
MGKKDIISKGLLKRLALDLATILLKLEIDPDRIELLDTEKQRIEDRRVDLVLRVCDANSGETYLLHIEIQNNNDLWMPLRMLRYYTDIAFQWPGEPIRQYVIYIGQDELRMPEQLRMETLQYRYQILDMRTVDCQTLLQQDSPDALVMAILCDFKGRPAKDVVNYILQRLRTLTGADEKDYRRCVSMLEILSENRYLQATVKEVEGMLTEVEQHKLPSYQLGMEQGLEQGLERGASAVVRSLLVHMPPAEVARLTGLDLQRVEQIAKAQ